MVCFVVVVQAAAAAAAAAVAQVMPAPGEDGSIASELGDSKEEIEEHGSEYSLEFDDDEANRENSPARKRSNSTSSSSSGQRQRSAAPDVKEGKQGGNDGDGQISPRRDPQKTPRQTSPAAAGAAAPAAAAAGGAVGAADSSRFTYGGPVGITRRSTPPPPPPIQSQRRGDPGEEGVLAAKRERTRHDGRRHPLSSGEKEPFGVGVGVGGGAGERGREDAALPVQFLALKRQLDAVGSVGRRDETASEALAAVAREHSALRKSLGTVERELLAARRKVAQDTAARLHAVHQKSARADARRAKHLEQLGEARRAAAVAERASETLRARLEEKESEWRHAKDLLATARSSVLAAEERGEEWKNEAATAKDEAEGVRKALAGVRLELEQERTRGAIAAREAADNLELCERKRELEVDTAKQAAEARDRVVQVQLAQLPEHQQQLLQAEMDRVARWEERLVAEAANLQRREETHKSEMEACRAQAGRAEAESRGRVEAEVARERASLREANSALEVERRELLQRAARAEAVGEAKAVEAAALKAEVTEARRKLEAEKAALDTRAALLAPQFLGLEEARSAVESARREAREEARRARDEACRARELEAGVVEREAAVEVKWEETAGARRAVQQMERRSVEEADALAEQRKAVALAGVRLHEQQMEMTLQMSEIRKALDLMKRVERLEDKGARRLALELGTVACERGEQQARSSSAKLESEEAVCRRVKASELDRAAACAGISEDSVVVSCRRGDRESLPTAILPREEAIGEAGHPWTLAGDVKDGVRRGVYADEAGAREALEKVRSALSSGRGMRGGSMGPDEGGGGTLEGVSVQAWAARLKAAAVASGAHRI